MMLKTRREAKEAGAYMYFPGTPCKHGHVYPKTLKSGCIRCATIKRFPLLSPKAQAFVLREEETYRQEGKYYTIEKKPKREKKPPVIKPPKKPRLTDNPNYKREWHATRLLTEPDYQKEWYRNNKQRTMDNTFRRNHLLGLATPKYQDVEELLAVYRQRGPGDHVDHGIPLKHELVCGLNVPCNLYVIEAERNYSKGAYFDSDEWSYQDGKFVRTIGFFAPDYKFDERGEKFPQPTGRLSAYI